MDLSWEKYIARHANKTTKPQTTTNLTKDLQTSVLIAALCVNYTVALTGVV